jgi:hypothetical protein
MIEPNAARSGRRDRNEKRRAGPHSRGRRMLPGYRIVDKSLLFRALWRMAKYVLSLSVGMTVITCYFFTSTAFTRNRDGDYCDYYNERTIYYARDDCYVIVPALLERFSMFFFPSFVIYLFAFSIAVLGVFLMYLHYAHERLGMDQLTDGN